MSKRRIVLIVDDTAFTSRWGYLYDPVKYHMPPLPVTVESIEDIPEPNRVQEFRVRVTSPADSDPMTRDSVLDVLVCVGCRLSTGYIANVTEVDPT